MPTAVLGNVFENAAQWFTVNAATGGGGGGVIVVISRSVISGAVAGQTINVSGGTGGALVGGGATGSNGNIGTKIMLQN